MQPESPGPGAGLDDWLRWQEQLHPASIVLGLDRVAEVAGRMALPAAGPRTITVAGTNGKGSTSAFLTAMLGAAGIRTGTYTSPHLLRYNERICIDGVPVPDEQLCDAFLRVEQHRQGTQLTYFEFGTLAALEVFRRAGVEVQVLEVGLGGRLDAVNIVDADVAIVTSIGLDHTEYLGDSLDQIAAEKAGILRPGRPAVLADLIPALQQAAVDTGARVVRVGTDYRWREAGGDWDFHGVEWNFNRLPRPTMAGAYQLANAAAAIAALEQLAGLGIAVGESAVRTAVPNVRLPGRFQRHGSTILDVAHNVEAAEVLAVNLKAAGAESLYLVLGMLSDKPVAEFAAALPAVDRLYAASLPPPRGLSAEELVARVALSIPSECHRSPADAWRAARSRAAEGVTILVCGSFMTVAGVMEVLS